MSRTTLVGLRESGQHVYPLELGNSWGSAPLVWNALAIKYLGTEDHRYFERIEDIAPALNEADAPWHHCILYGLTCHRCFVARGDHGRVADAIDRFLVDFPVPRDRVNHWPAIAAFLRENEEEAVGIWSTSVDCSPYEEWDEDKEEPVYLRVADLFDVVAAVTAEASEATSNGK